MGLVSQKQVQAELLYYGKWCNSTGIFENHPGTTAYFIIPLPGRSITHGANFQPQMATLKP